jgi:hypothetical protein
MKSSAVKTHHDPCIWEEEIGLLEGLHVFVSMDRLVGHIRNTRKGDYFEFAI